MSSEHQKPSKIIQRTSDQKRLHAFGHLHNEAAHLREENAALKSRVAKLEAVAEAADELIKVRIASAVFSFEDQKRRANEVAEAKLSGALAAYRVTSRHAALTEPKNER